MHRYEPLQLPVLPDVTSFSELACAYVQLALLCEVCDQTRNPPELQELSATAERGRGILLVNELSGKWGHRRTASGKIVWCTLPIE